MPEQRIVSLIASATEIVCALGFGDKLVGRSHECDYPVSVKSLPQCTAPKFRLDGTSYEIDQRVRALVAEALSVYRVDAQAIENLKPTHIITQAQCEVCAVSLNDVEQAVCEITSTRPVIVSLKPDSLTDVWDDIMKVGTALGAQSQAKELIQNLQDSMRGITTKAQGLATRPTVAYIEWIDPLMAGGNWMPELVEAAGGTSLFAVSGKHSPQMSWPVLCEADPDIIFISPCGFDIARTLQETGLLKEKAGWRDLRAVQSGRVFVADGNQFFNRPGPRLLESLQILAETIHPEAFCFNHEGEGWVRLDTAKTV
jgi:iron complex transport system substrate-binding protein